MSPTKTRLERSTVLAKAAFLARWQKVSKNLSEASRKATLKASNGNSKAGANGALFELRFSWAAKKFEYDVIVENTEQERRYQELSADVIGTAI